MKLKSYLYMAAALFAAAATTASCGEPDEIVLHTDSTLTTIYIGNIAQNDRGVQGVIRENNDIIFTIPYSMREEIDRSNVLIWATVPVDARVTPSLYGRHDLSQPMVITVTAEDGSQTQYQLIVQDVTY